MAESNQELEKGERNVPYTSLEWIPNSYSITRDTQEEVSEEERREKTENWVLFSQPVRIIGYLPTLSAIFSR